MHPDAPYLMVSFLVLLDVFLFTKSTLRMVFVVCLHFGKCGESMPVFCCLVLFGVCTTNFMKVNVFDVRCLLNV